MGDSGSPSSLSRADHPDPATLGWRGPHSYDSPEVVAARAVLESVSARHLPVLASQCLHPPVWRARSRSSCGVCPHGQRNGIQGLEVIDPAADGFAQRAATLFHRDGVSTCTTTSSPVKSSRSGSSVHIQRLGSLATHTPL